MVEVDYSIDTQKIREQLLAYYEQIQSAAVLGKNVDIENSISHIYVVGMGGSGLAGRLLHSYLVKSDVQVTLVQDFQLPKQVDENSLVFILSYSGNTAETIECYRQTTRTKAAVVAMSTGGKVEQLAPVYRSQYIKLPDGMHPRMALGYMFFAVLSVLQHNGVVPDQTQEIVNSVLAVKKTVYEKTAQSLAEKIGEKIPVIISSTESSVLSYFWKIAMNENAKSAAFCNVVPEMDHNELEGYTHTKGQLFTIILKCEDDSRFIQQRMDALKSTIHDSQNDIVEMAIKGKDRLSRLISAIYLGYWVSYYVALLRGVNPGPIETIEGFKKKLK